MPSRLALWSFLAAMAHGAGLMLVPIYLGICRTVETDAGHAAAAELMAGKLCVMLYLKTDHKEKDEKGLNTLHSAIASSPFGKIITVVELSRNSLEEHHFASMLLNVEDDLMDIQEPMLFGIFGRFKALEPLLGKGISEENIHLMIDYFTAECSCLIKDDLPGTDILFSDKWANPKTALLNKIIDDNPALGE